MKAILTLDNRTFREIDSFEYHPGQTTTRLTGTIGSGSLQPHAITRNLTDDQCGFVTDEVIAAETPCIAVTDSGYQYSFRAGLSEPRGDKHFQVGTVTRREPLDRKTFDYLYAKHILKQTPEQPQ